MRHTHTRIHIQRYICTHTNTHTHTYTHARTHARTQTHSHIHTYTYTHRTLRLASLLAVIQRRPSCSQMVQGALLLLRRSGQGEILANLVASVQKGGVSKGSSKVT
jgi:hypothetical protein